MRRILGLSSIRADYDLLSSVYRYISKSANVDFKVAVTGTHLSPVFGLTVSDIRRDGFEILCEIETLICSDSSGSRLKSAALAMLGLVDTVANWDPECIIFAGDREDVIIGGLLGTYLGIPTFHFFGGDHELDGHADTAVRHATSKLASFHFVASDEHKRRLLSLGESDSRICMIGSVAIDKFRFTEQIPLECILPSDKDMTGYALVIYHPLDARREDPRQATKTIIDTLLGRQIPIIILYPNSDPGSREIIACAEKYRDHSMVWIARNLRRDHFVNVFKGSKFLVGNSSAGILESASLGVGAINFGLRQLGRSTSDNVIFCGNSSGSLNSAIDTVLSINFKKKLLTINNVHEGVASSQRAAEIILKMNLRSLVPKLDDPLQPNKKGYR